jgi:hypothetical protein
VTEPATIMAELDQLAAELDKRTLEQAQVERELEPLDAFYEEALDDFEVACWDEHVKNEAKLPSAEMRERLARRTMPAAVLSSRSQKAAKRKRLERRTKALGTLIDAKRSSLSAAKAELEAVSS